jgi:hypothetical protein
MPRLPGYFHPLAGGNPQRGLTVRPIRRVPIEAYTSKVQGVPLQGGQGQAIVSGGTATITVGPQGLGVIWYPVQCNVSSSVGANDLSTVAVYLGQITVGTLQGGQSYAGGGDTVALAVQQMAPGQNLIAVWSDAVNGSTVYLNVTGTMDAPA